MNKLEDAPELKAAFEKAQRFIFFANGQERRHAEHFFIAGYQAAVAERAKFDEQNELIVKDLINTHEVIQ